MAPVTATLEAPKQLMTADEFWDFVHRPENRDRQLELHRGEVIELSRPTRQHGAVVNNIGRILGNYSFDHNRGYSVSGDAGVVLDEDPATVVGPDVAYFLDANKFKEVHPKWGGDVPILAVEVLSPNDKLSEVNEKIEDYFSSGVKVVWLADYEEKKGTIYRSDTSQNVLDAADDLDGGNELPGFRCKVGDFFRLPGDRPAATPVG